MKRVVWISSEYISFTIIMDKYFFVVVQFQLICILYLFYFILVIDRYIQIHLDLRTLLRPFSLIHGPVFKIHYFEERTTHYYVYIQHPLTHIPRIWSMHSCTSLATKYFQHHWQFLELPLVFFIANFVNLSSEWILTFLPIVHNSLNPFTIDVAYIHESFKTSSTQVNFFKFEILKSSFA